MNRLLNTLEAIPVRIRLALVHAAWLALIFFIVGFVVCRLLESNLQHAVNTALISSAKSIRSAHFNLAVNNYDSHLRELSLDPLPVDQWSGTRWVKPLAQIISVSGEIQTKTPNVIAQLPVTQRAIARAETGQWTLETFVFKDRPPFRQITLPIIGPQGFTGHLVQVGTSMRHTQEIMQGSILILLVFLPIILVISVICGYFLTARAFTPVRLMTKAVHHMGIDTLGQRLPVPMAHDELRELASIFNSLFDRIEDSVKRLKRFTGDVSHELRTPLAVILGEAQLTLKKPRTPEEYCRALAVVNKESQHMTMIVQDLLLFARASSEQMAIKLEPIVTQEFFHNLIASVQPLYEARRIKLSHTLGAIPEFWASPGYMTLILKNILINAAKHSPKDSSVHLSFYEEQDTLTFVVRDHGEGIAPEDFPYIFDPFYRVDTVRNRASGGTGIGLSLAQTLVKLHGGEIQVKSTLHEGSAFSVHIPVHREVSQKSNSLHGTQAQKKSSSQNPLPLTCSVPS